MPVDVKRIVLACILLIACLGSTIAKSPKIELWRNRKIRLFTTIQLAVNNAIAGDSISIKAGVYHENIRIENRSGTATRPIKIVGTGLVTIDGADPELQTIGNSRWTKTANNIYITHRIYSGSKKWNRIALASGGQDETRLCTYWFEQKFNQLAYGAGVLLSNDQIKIKLLDGQSPTRFPIHIGTADAIIKFQNANYWQITSLELKNGGFAGVYLAGNNASDIVLNKLTIRNCFRGISTDEADSGENIRIENCTVQNDASQEWPWEGYEDSGSAADDSQAPQRTCGIMIKAAQNVQVKNCKIIGWWDGMKLTGKNIKASQNHIRTVYDDMVELESSFSDNVSFFDNTGCDVFVGISLVNNIGGNVYVYRNTIFCTKQITSSRSKGTYGYSIKLGGGWGEKRAENVKVYHNNFYARRANFWDARKVEFKNFAFVNNIFYTEKNDRNFLNQDTLTHTFKNGTIWLNNLWNKSTLNESGGVFSAIGIAIFLDAKNDCYTFVVNDLSNAINAGSNYVKEQNWPDSVPLIGKPDIGAMER